MNNVELWAYVPEYEDYMVSNQGKIKSFKKKQPRLLKIGKDRWGKQHFVKLSNEEGSKGKVVPWLVANIFLDKGEHDSLRHKNGDGFDDRAENLEWYTKEK